MLSLFLASQSRYRCLSELYSACSKLGARARFRPADPSLSRRHGPHRRHIHRHQLATTEAQKTNSDVEHHRIEALQHRIAPFEKQDQAARRLIDDGAIVEALSGKADTLHRCLALYLQEGNYTTVTDIYGRYASRYDATGSSQPQTTKSEEQVVDNNQVRALLCAITAHAVQRSFEPLLQAYIKTGILEIPHHLRDEHLDSLKTTISTEVHITSYIDDLNTAFFVSNPRALISYTKSLKKSNSSRSLIRLYEGVLKGITRPQPFITACESHHSTLPLVMTEICWAAFLSAFVRCKRVDLASRLWDDLAELKVKKGTALWTSLIGGYDELRLSSSALSAWRQMLSEGVRPDALTYQAIISVLFKGKQSRQALGMFGEFQANERRCDPTQCLVVYNTVVKGLLRNQLLPQAEQILKMMKERGFPPDVITYNTLLDHFRRNEDYHGLLDVISRMEEAGVQGDVYSFTTLLNALLRAGKKNAMEIVLHTMKEQGVQANAAIYSSLIAHQLSMEDEGHLHSALGLLTSMEENYKIAPNNVTYTSFLTRLHRGNWLTPEKREAHRIDLIRRMNRQGIRFSLQDYHILIKACFTGGDQDGPASAVRYYHDMKRRGIQNSNSTSYMLLAGFLEHNMGAEAMEIVRHIKLSGINPSASLSRLMRKAEETHIA